MMAQKSPDIIDEFITIIEELDGRMGSDDNDSGRPTGRASLRKLKKKEDEMEPIADISDNGKELIVVAELRGVNKDTVSIRIEGNILEVKADLKRSYLSGADYDGNGRVHRKISLPARVDAKKVSYGFNNGVLEVRMPKA
jgi:HSP20 family molecular chaperone IbpA